MSGVFLSYKKDIDAARARVVRTKLEACGIEVFQDVDMSAGSDFHSDLYEQISMSAAVLVLWTKSSITSRWVTAEAQHGLDAEKLVAVTFDLILPRDMRMPFNGIQTPDVSDWIDSGGHADHPGWKSALKALGVLLKRPLSEIADIVERGSPKMKADFVRNNPADRFSAGLAAELRAAKLLEFEHLSARTKTLAEKRLAEETRRLKQLSTEFAGLIDVALNDGTLDMLDAKQAIQRALGEDEDGKPGRRKRKAPSEDVDRMRAEIKALQDEKSAAEDAKTEIADIAASQSAQLVDANGKLQDLQDFCDQARVRIDNQTLEIQDLQKRDRQKKPPVWLMAVVGATLGAGALWFVSGGFPSNPDKVLAELTAAKKQLVASNSERDSLFGDNKRLADQVDAVAKKIKIAEESVSRDKKDLSDQVGALSARLDSATKQSSALGNERDLLSKDKKQLLDERDSLSRDKKQLSDQLALAGKEKQKSLEQLNDANTKLDAANAKMASSSQQAVAASVIQSAEVVRAAKEARCNELAAYYTDADLPSDAKRPANPSKIPSGTGQEVIDNCLGALSFLPKETTRRILVQLSRGYILLGHASRPSDQTSATDSYSIGVSVAEFAFRLGSAQAEMILGYIYSGGFNSPKLKYVFPNSPNYPYAWARFQGSAATKNPYGLLYAGSYLVWPGCSQNAVASVPEKGLQYLHEAQDKKIAEAFYAEGYYWYFGVPGVKSDPGRAVGLFDKAKQLNFAEADAFLSKSPPKPDTCPKVIF